MLRRLFIASSLALFSLTALPVVGQQAGIANVTAEAALVRKVKKVKRVKKVRSHRNKRTYQYVPTSSGRPGAWR